MPAEQKPVTRAFRLEEGAPDGALASAGSNVEILTDTQGVDFGPYLAQVVRVIKRNWYSIIPQSAGAPLYKKGKVTIEFAIGKNGEVEGLHIIRSSGDISLDRSAYGGIHFSDPFPPLPSAFSGPYLGLRMKFLYNPALKGISPSGVQVRAGSSIQFSPVLNENAQPMDSVINWTVVGRGCNGSACGTISDQGLYTAPPTVPNNQVVRVRATAQTDLDETVFTVVTILPADISPKPAQ